MTKKPDNDDMIDQYCTAHDAVIFKLPVDIAESANFRTRSWIETAPAKSACVIIATAEKATEVEATSLAEAFARKYQHRTVIVPSHGGITATMLAISSDVLVMRPAATLLSLADLSGSDKHSAELLAGYGTNLKDGGVETLLQQQPAGATLDAAAARLIFKSVQLFENPLADICRYVCMEAESKAYQTHRHGDPGQDVRRARRPQDVGLIKLEGSRPTRMTSRTSDHR